MPRRDPAGSDRGFFAVGIVNGKSPQNIGTLWRSAVLYRAALLFTVGRRYERRQSSDTGHASQHVPLLHFASIDDLIEHLPHSCPLVGVEMDPRATPLDRFEHPQRAAYLLGAEDHGLSHTAIDRCHQLVQIEAGRPASMNVATAGSIVMYHRHVQKAARRPVGVP